MTEPKPTTRDADSQAPAAASGAGRLADLVSDGSAPAVQQRWDTATLIKMAALGGLFVAMNWWQFPILIGTWQHDPDWSHGFLIPLFSIYLLYVRRDELLSAPRKINMLGLPLLMVFIATTVLGYYPIGTYWVSHASMVFSLFALVLYMAGSRVIKVTWLPILFLLFAMPLPERLYTAVSLPLQNIAAQGATVLLQIIGVEVQSKASHLVVTSYSGVKHPLTVAEACSGMRLLMAFLALGVAMAYIERRPLWQRLVLMGMGIPVAVFTNVLRVTITSYMFVLDRPELGKDFMHEFTGMLMLGPALAMLWLLGWLLQVMFVEEGDETDEEPSDEDDNPSVAGGEVEAS